MATERSRTAVAAPRTVGDWLARIERRFTAARLAFGHGTTNPRDEAAWLTTSALGIAFEDLARVRDRAVPPAAARRLARIAAARITTRKPLAYLLNEAWLGAHRFYVDERVIVPRSFIAEVLRAAKPPWHERPTPARVLDLCTGSGCLAILAALAFPDAHVDAVDRSPDALAVAARNVRDYRLARRVRLVESDLFAALGATRYDLILTNPPYVDAPAMRALPAEYRREPRLALDGGTDGLDLVARILDDAPAHLAAGGWVVLEIGHNRAAFERRWPNLRSRWASVRWLATSAGRDLVVALRAAQPQRTS